jgi:proteasome accessory factor B
VRARKPTYGAATRLARLVLGLQARPHGWSFTAVQEALGISERTLLRYLRACREELVDAEGRPLIETTGHAPHRHVHLRGQGELAESTVYQVLFFYFALSVFQFLDGTVIKEGVADLWERFLHSLPLKDYSGCDETLDTVVRGLVDQRRLRIDYGGLLGAGKAHVFDPYTLLMYRGGLYLLGRSDRGRQVIALAIERIRAVALLPDRFPYPSPQAYSPEKHTEGIFGLIGGPSVDDVELLIHNDETHAYLASRRLHRSQRFAQRRDGRYLLRMRVRGLDELTYWILGFGPHLEVRRPGALRAAVGELLAAAAARYQPRRR